MPANIVVPEMGESIVDARVARWLKNEGDAVTIGEPLVELETDKVDIEVSATQNGVLEKILQPAGADVKIGEVLGVIEPGSGAETPAAPPAATPAPAPAKAEPAEAAPERSVTPVARRMAEQEQIDLAAVAPSSSGRVTKGDVQRYLQHSREAAPAPSKPTPPPPAAETNGYRREEVVKMSRRRRTIAARLVEAQHTAAMLTTFNEVDMTRINDLRDRRKEAFKQKYGVSLGLSSFFVKAAIGALKAFPRLNAEIRGDDMILKHYYDIGVAIGAEEGLVVPVLRDADRMSFAEIEKKIKQFAAQANDGTLSLEDLRGGTFTITNGGVFGSLMSTPILNPPQVGILGLHKIQERPMAVNGQVAIRPMMYIALSYDHRIVDGREAVQFLVRVKELVEDPESLLIEG
jgi:2-oxoglutarate dehydrogenase E2 component (dihydrolipoamide succinyltransferase)